jgi:ubiquinone/menaquinone biosynthesis C-methylase UbiE
LYDLSEVLAVENKIKGVIDWYTTEKNYAYMPMAANNELKLWEKEVSQKYFHEGSYILDIGCGMGREAFALYDMGHKIAAVDISEPIIMNAIKLAVQSGRKIDFSIINGLDLPFNNNTFDAVIIWAQTFGLLYGEKNKKHMLNECKRVLKTNGILSFSAHEREFEEKNYPQYLDGNKFWAYKECYWEVLSMDELSSFAENAGLKVLNCQQGQVYKPEDGTIIHCVCRK